MFTGQCETVTWWRPISASSRPPEYERERAVELLAPRRLVDDALEPPLLVAHPAPGIVARAEIGAQAEPLDLGEQRFLHAKLAAELHERRGAVAQHLGHGERREQAVAGLRVRVGGARVGRGPPHPRAPARDGDLGAPPAVEDRP